MGGTTAIQKEDYELYHIQMPFLLRQKKRRAYLSRELEKEHPCFSDRCACDTTYRLQKWKLVAQVAVIDSVRLAQYHAQFPGKKLVLESERNRIVFMEGKQKLIYVFIAVCLLIAMSFVLYVSISVPANTKKKLLISSASTELAEQKKLRNQNAPSVEPEDVCRTLLASVKEHGGVITDFFYKYGTIHVSLSNCYPEELSFVPVDVDERLLNITPSAVSYEDGVPFFTTDISFSEALINSIEENNNEIDTFSVVLPLLRKKLLESHTKILSEDVTTKSISFSTPVKEFEKRAECLTSFGREQNVSLESLTVSFAKDTVLCTASYSIAKEMNGIELPVIVAQNTNNQASKRNTYETASTVAKKMNGEKIGQISTAEGKRIVFYRESSGKIKGVYE